jgi:hypothetical protein
MTLIDMEKAALNLTAKERALLSYKLLESIETENREEPDKFWQEEVENRYKEYRNNDYIMKDAATVLNEARSKYSK